MTLDVSETISSLRTPLVDGFPVVATDCAWTKMGTGHGEVPFAALMTEGRHIEVQSQEKNAHPGLTISASKEGPSDTLKTLSKGRYVLLWVLTRRYLSAEFNDDLAARSILSFGATHAVEAVIT